METYALNETNPVAPSMKDWAFAVPSSSTFAFYYVPLAFAAPTAFAAMTGFGQFQNAWRMAVALREPRSYGDALEELYAFDVLPDLDALAEAQGVSPTTDVRDLATDDWPEDESVEDFIAAAMKGRYEEDEPDS